MSNESDAPIRICHHLLNTRDFKSVQSFVETNRLIGNEWPELDQAEAISDVIIAANSWFPNGFRDYYGMIRAKRFGSVVVDDLLKLWQVLDVKSNRFPCINEAANYALKAWTMFSQPGMKSYYDRAIFAYTSANSGNRYDGTSLDDGNNDLARYLKEEGTENGGGISGLDKGKEKVEPIISICSKCLIVHENEVCMRCIKVPIEFASTTEMIPSGFPASEKAAEGFPNSSLIRKEHDLGRGTEDAVIVISDDDSDDGDGDGWPWRRRDYNN